MDQTQAQATAELEKVRAESVEMRARFQDLVMKKEDEIAALEDKNEEWQSKYQDLLSNAKSSGDGVGGDQAEIQDLREENEFLATELQKLKRRYTKLMERMNE